MIKISKTRPFPRSGSLFRSWGCRYLVYIDSVIQKLENGTRDDKSINFMSQLERELKSLWQRIMQSIENELATNNNKSIKSEQEIAVLQQQYSKFTDSYIS